MSGAGAEPMNEKNNGGQSGMLESQTRFQTLNGKRKILVVEDEMINQEILKFILQENYDVLIASNGSEALEIADRELDMLSLVLLDLNLPDMHGLDVLRQLRTDARTSRVPVIVMTAEKEAEVESLTVGAIDFIPKPYPQPKVILARVLRTIELNEDRALIRSTERDQLTGLYTREYFYRYAQQFDLYHKDTAMDAVVLDINHFHMINERYGRAYGDELLRHVANTVRERVSDAGGIVCRREADTFLIYCPHREDYDAFLNTTVQSIKDDGKAGSRLRMRIGVYANSDKDIDLERRFDRAKLAADTIRHSFSKTVAIYDDSLHETEVYSEQLLEDFASAIEEKQFLVYYQPKFDIRPDDPVLSSAEALVRWKHPQLGMISPGVFIPLFEQNGLIQQLDHYVWEVAAAQIRDWRERLGLELPVSVNVSRIDMYDPALPEKLEDIVRRNQLQCSDLLLEITESAYTENSGQIIESVQRLRKAGFRIEMDDFGSGYSSLNMLSTLPIDALKLDMQFIRNAFRERKDTRLLEFVISLADSLGVPTIAEGVETAEQLFTLKIMGCDIVQGYYFSRPLPADAFEEYMRNAVSGQSDAEKKEQETDEQKLGSAQFTYAAVHDPLTGLYNHSGFDILFHDADKNHLAVLLANVDGYAQIRDGKGREQADAVIQRVASVLRSSFRSVDDICRLKDDEFVVIMTRVTSAMRNLVFTKMQKVNEILQHPDDGSEPVSLSVGVAFSDRESPRGDIFQDADTALNRMKQIGSSGCAIY